MSGLWMRTYGWPVALALVVVAIALPSGIYPPLQFPRIVIVAHSGTLPPRSMSLIVTRPIELTAEMVAGVQVIARADKLVDCTETFRPLASSPTSACTWRSPSRGRTTRIMNGSPK